MRAVIDYRPERGAYNVYLGTEDVALYYKDGELAYAHIRPHEERPVFLRLSAEQYIAIRDAILATEAPRLAEPALLKEMLDDARKVRDRLLTLVERR